MATGACGIDCGVCRLHRDGLCSTCGPGNSEEASRKLAAQVRLLGAPCPMLGCAHTKGIAFCLQDCDEFPCDRFFQGPYPFSSDFLLMQERRRGSGPLVDPPRKATIPVDPVHWDALMALDPREVTQRCLCRWDPERGYEVPFLGETYWVHPASKSVRPGRHGVPLEAQLPLLLVIFLLNAKDRPLRRKMVTERELPGGDLFFRHLHRLPTQPLEEAFGRRPQAFMQAGLALGARPEEVGDASFQLTPLARIPVGFHLWPADDEFPARCVITFDASIHEHLPLDVIWALTQILAQRLMTTDEA